MNCRVIENVILVGLSEKIELTKPTQDGWDKALMMVMMIEKCMGMFYLCPKPFCILIYGKGILLTLLLLEFQMGL